ncbi:MAG: GNAT family N-acetyltransferase [Chloroflexota bacterium]
MPPELSFHLLTDARDPAFGDVLSIYCEAFPDDQRMSHGRIANLLDRRAMHITACASGGEIVGFSACLRPAGHAFAWLEYFAVRRGLRGGGIGSALFRWTAATATSGAAGMLLEIEPPETAPNDADRRLRVTRLNFYQRLGCLVLIDFPYQMWTASGDVPMQLLLYPGAAPGPATAADRSRLYALIHGAVADRRRFYLAASAEWRQQQIRAGSDATRPQQEG